MAVARICLAWLGLLAAVETATAQQATTVQLPSFHFFTVNTTVSVPDRGSVSLGGVGGVSTGSTAYSSPVLPLQRNFGSAMGASQLSVHATIHDLAARDAAILGQAGSSAGSSQNALSQAAVLSAAAVRTAGVAEAKRQRADELAAVEREAVDYFRRGQAAEAAGKPGSTKIWYQMAARRATGDLKTQLTARLQALAEAQSARVQNQPQAKAPAAPAR